jgi:hypothetical protein
MTFVVYFQNGYFPTSQPTLGGMPFGEPARIPRYVPTHIITDVPEGTTKATVAEKWGSSNSSIQLEFCAESECPDSVKTQIQAPNLPAVVWSSL